MEIERINEIGEGLVKLFVSLEAAIGAKHKDFIKSEAFKGINEGVKGDFAAKIAEAEAPGTSLHAVTLSVRLPSIVSLQPHVPCECVSECSAHVLYSGDFPLVNLV